MTSTPLLGSIMLKKVEVSEDFDPYAGTVFQLYRKGLETCIKFRWITVLAVVGVFVASLWAFGFISNSFFPDSTRPQFYVEYWRPEGTHIKDTAKDTQQIAAWIREQEGVTSTASFAGQGPPRFLLTFSPEDVNPAYGCIVVSVEDWRTIDDMSEDIREYIAENYPDAQGWCKKFVVGPGKGAKIEAQFSGPDRAVLRQLAEKSMAFMRDDPAAVNIRHDWRHQVKVLRPNYLENQARVAGVSRPDLASGILAAFEGRSVGVYREHDDLLPIFARAPANERSDVNNMRSAQLWATATNRAVPFNQVVGNLETAVDDNIIRRVDRKRALRAQCDFGFSTAETLRKRLAKQIEALELPSGYEFEWRGEFYSSQKAQAALAGKLPFTFIAMILIVVLLFDRMKQPIIIYLMVPLALIGVTVGLLITKQPFGFMALLGFLSLSGMLIKNAIVLIDETDGLIREGGNPYESVVLAGVSRARPVAMAALTTMLGMIPLFQDAFFIAMAVTIVFGLGFATVLTLIVVPVLYAIFFKIREGDPREVSP
jgi:multidrug efflux pump subunit AcrB